jgi:hypothetical protein
MLFSALELGSAFGATMTLAMVCDLVFVFMGHIQLCYLVSVTVYGHLLRLVASLWNLFRGEGFRDVKIWEIAITQSQENGITCCGIGRIPGTTMSTSYSWEPCYSRSSLIYFPLFWCTTYYSPQ